jgi:hypothetical protein
MSGLSKSDVCVRSRFSVKQITTVGAILALAAGLSVAATQLRAARGGEFNEPGNYLIADQFNNRVIEVEPDGDIVWQFGNGPDDLTATSIVGTNDAQRVGSLTLMAGTGIPGGQAESPACAALNAVNGANGCPDNRVLLVDRNKNIVWQYGSFGVSGSGFDQLNTPVQNTWVPVDDDEAGPRIPGVPSGHVLITDQANERIIEVNLKKEIVWQYPDPSDLNVADLLNNPNAAELLPNGHILISDENNNRAIEVNRAHKILHTFTAGGTVSGVAFASRLRNGDTLITDSNNSRIVEVDAGDNVEWEYFTNTDPNSNNNRVGGGPLPTRAVRLKNGDTLISDQYNHRVIQVNHQKVIVRTFGAINMLGYDTKNVSKGGLNSPYDAKAIGDYTGLTPPFGE